MLLKSLSLLLAALPLVLGQYGGGAATSTPASSAATATQTASAGVAGVHIVDVGQGGLLFTPNVTTAAVGEKVEFHFFGPIHSVAQGNFDTPCAPGGPTAFFSGGFAVNGSAESASTFTITINNTQPIFFYCGIPTHCQLGMVGVINPSTTNTSQTLDLYKAAALKTTNTTRPAQGGGVIGPAATASNSSTASSTSSSAPAASSSKASDATFARSQVGWVGVVAAGVVAWGVSLLMG